MQSTTVKQTLQVRESLTISLIIPVFNESEAINIFINRIEELFATHEHITIEYIFINDGSSDETLTILLARQAELENINIIDFSRNFGKEAALSAGLDFAQGNITIPIDIDLQDPPELIFDMLEKWHEGYEVVLAKRLDRSSDTFFKRISAKYFYKIHNSMASLKIPENVGDFRLMDHKVVDALKQLPESERFMKGIFSWIGFRTTAIEYTRPKRTSGTSKFNGWKLWNFALDGITSFSTVPLRSWFYIGIFVTSIVFAYALYLFFRTLLFGVELPGYASLMLVVLFLGGLQLIGIGVIGEYLGRTYLEAKRRPTYVIRHLYGSKEEKN